MGKYAFLLLMLLIKITIYIFIEKPLEIPM